MASKLANTTALSRIVKWILWLLLAAFVGSLFFAGNYLYPFVYQGATRYHEYLNFNWAHQADLVLYLLQFGLALWALMSAFYFCGWFIHRLLRKARGKSWVLMGSDNRKRYLPALSKYLKISVVYLSALWLFVVAQYPLQFM